MSISTKYNPGEVEDKWYAHWMGKGYFKSTPDPEKEPYTIMIPPPNVTGVLHMGHMLNNTIQDILIRKARMEGKEACWVPGTDHASIATEAKVVAMLKEKGIGKKDISREKFLKHAFEWKEKYGGIILEQLKKLGASCDWDRTYFTMDEERSAAVIQVFVDLYNKGLIYRGVRMVNWDPEGKTALSDDEVIHKEVQSKLYYINYPVEGEESHVTIATTRPETIMADTAVCINPNDDRYKHLKGKKVLIPLINRAIPVIEDEYVTMDFGTGCLKVTPAHDINDYELGIKHQLEAIDIINDDGSLNEKAQILVGEDRFVARKQIAKMLETSGNLQKVEDYTSNVGFSERTDAAIEPKLSMQWFLKMDQLTIPALENVMNDKIRFVPAKFKNTYRNWMENIRDWTISRQLWWGHQIPAYFMPNGECVVAATKEEALILAQKKDANITINELTQDEDVLDTWFSSWLVPISGFNGFSDPENEEINYYYPTSDLVTGPDIIFFWVARMIVAGYEYRGEMPFKNVYFTGIVRDKLGRKMSKSLGNSPDPLELMQEYGADAVRTGLMLSAPAGNDLLYDVKLVEQGRNFANKIWNAFRLVKGWGVDDQLNGQSNETATRWFRSKFNQALGEIEDHFSKFRISDALMTIYKLIWDDFCSWYLEMIKPAYGESIDSTTYQQTLDFFEQLMKILHPFMPFLTEEIWNNIRERKEGEDIIVSQWPDKENTEESLLGQAATVFDLISQVRNTRNAKGISPKKALTIAIKTQAPEAYQSFTTIIQKMANISEITFTSGKVNGALGLMVKTDEVFIPMEGEIDIAKEKETLAKELEYTKGFLNTVMKKLGNERFVNNAPEQVIASERKKQADAETKIKALETQLAQLG